MNTPFRGDIAEGKAPTRVALEAMRAYSVPPRSTDVTKTRDLMFPRSGPQGPMIASDFTMVGVFYVDWLNDPTFKRMLDNMAASPGAFKSVRFFGSLTSHNDPTKYPTTTPNDGGTVWTNPNSQPDFTNTLSALNELVSRDLIPFVVLSFFPQAVSPTPITPPADFAKWQQLVADFLSAVVNKYGQATANWWFEVWNEPNNQTFWADYMNLQSYFALYQATSKVVVQSGLNIRLGGPAAYLDTSTAPIQQFLSFLKGNPTVKCDFLSFHAKGADEDYKEGAGVTSHPITVHPLPDLSVVTGTADMIAQLVISTAPNQFANLSEIPIFNEEADEKAGFDIPFPDRLTERETAWLAGVMTAYDALSAQYSQNRLRFHAASDNANLQLVNNPFVAVRSIMTRSAANLAPRSPIPADLYKLASYNFYEMLRFLNGEHGFWLSGAGSVYPNTPLFWMVVYTPTYISNFHTVCPRTEAEWGNLSGSYTVDLTIKDIPWTKANVVWFEIDHTRANSFTAYQVGQSPAAIRSAQELAVAAPVSTVPIAGGIYHSSYTVAPYETKLLWITNGNNALQLPSSPWIEAVVENNGQGEWYVVLRWTPCADANFFRYVLYLGAQSTPLTGVPSLLRSAIWIDFQPPHGTTRKYGVQVISSGQGASAITWSNPVLIP